MENESSLDDLFKGKIFRIPDYQRGYAWQKEQLKDFWEDLVNLSNNRSHYTGVLTLKEIDSKNIDASDNEYWLIEDHSYKMYHIVDGQQRLTTFVVFLQAFIDLAKQISENAGKTAKEIYIADSLSLDEVISKYLYKIKPTGDQYRTYKFGYTVDNPSYNYLKYKIFNEDGAPSIEETFYTLNLKNAKIYFEKQLKEFYRERGMNGLQEIYKKLTKKFMFNEYKIKNDFDVFVAFETMNNRGKQLSNLELLKNRLIYLTTLYTDEDLDSAGRRSLRDSINESWKEVYYQLGRNDKHPLNDNDFLKAHWIIYFQYSRRKANDYINFLLNEKFSPKKIYKETEHEVKLDLPEEYITDFDIDIDDADIDDEVTEENTDLEDSYIDFVNKNTKAGMAGKPYLKAIRELENFIQESIFDAYSLEQLSELKGKLSKYGELHAFNASVNNNAPGAAIGQLIKFYNKKPKEQDKKIIKYLEPIEIKNYVNSLKESAVHWFNSHHPHLATDLSGQEKNTLKQLNRLGVGYFRPLIMSIFKNEKAPEKRIETLNEIERFIFIVFRLNQTRSNYRDSDFYIAARELNQGKLTLEGIKGKLDENAEFCFHDDGTFNSKDFYNFLYKRFNRDKRNGYYGWNGLRYFLYEYELELLDDSRQEKVDWQDLLKTQKDKISIEHIFPQTPTESWKSAFSNIDKKDYPLYSGSIGNLLLLSMSINSSLQNASFNDKKDPKESATGQKVRNGYSDGSHSEIEVSKKHEWTPAHIEERGLKLLAFMEKNWRIKFKNEETKESLLFPKKEDE